MSHYFLVIIAVVFSGGDFVLSGNNDTEYESLDVQLSKTVDFPVQDYFPSLKNNSGGIHILFFHINGQNFTLHLNEVPDTTGQEESMERFKTTNSIDLKTIRSDYTVTPGIGAYKLHFDHGYSWAKGHQLCAKEGGHLAVINSKAEYELLMEIIKSNKRFGYGCWIGVHDKFKDGEWMTVHDEPLAKVGFDEWINGYPEVGDMHCVGIYTEKYGIHNYNCSRPFNVMCEIALNN